MQAMILEIPAGAGGLISIWMKVGQCVYISVMEGGYPPATPICQMDLDQFHPLLVQAGFTYTGKGRLGKPFNGYEKKYPNGYKSHLKVFYQGESAEKVLHKCINEITFNIFKPGS